MLRACTVDELPPGESVRIAEGSGVDAIAVFNADGELYAIDDTCSHQDASLADGFLEGCFVECPLHAALFDLRTGLPSCLPAKKPVRTYTVLVDDGVIYVQTATEERNANEDAA
ncbi:MAG: bifunctional 3-phenylpropionate/cinnamic acid dioxygenase ferredoxin subunit [Amycolatopsis sp.]|jgi:3-phenylpropionate/trans-cinnamate dioxygenase ferredoxin subunit|uniref:bifunctional 3-phenylpropionate/cinnamic acid dioxygenase ferredoxin subunit n=1 Tax=Amycolatopsis sp. TaxID=37632 RepID=UPI002620B0BF|nr:bifunctional 3-phenylpropionate/cinnamic acid dioxygenase ferredoxin subunit [Amycolatopsis sp.]MCU1679568.1 bifunctional 3-phenylpropionate/cinnamic acid dioxygenase ferredoxin subunit [Amycolatopsis sp.]